jgi:hypothetical protein
LIRRPSSSSIARFANYDAFLAERQRVQTDVRKLSETAKSSSSADQQKAAQELPGALDAVEQLDSVLAPIVSFAHLYLLRRRVIELRVRLAMATVIAVLTLIVAVWAATAPESNENDSLDLRQGIKAYAQWPTIPQLYVKGEFVGGCDIIREMFQAGELQGLVKDKGPVKDRATA